MSFSIEEISKLIDDLINHTEAEFARKALDYLDGQQEPWVIELLNSNAGRRRWKERGMRPLFRNITGMIIEKSGLLWIGPKPKMDVVDNNGVILEDESVKFLDGFNANNGVELFTNLDTITRLLSTSIILVQWQDDKVLYDILHRGNSGVMTDCFGRPIVLVYKTYTSGAETGYRIITLDMIIDVRHAHGKYSVGAEMENPYGIIPIAQFYDEHRPRTAGFWVESQKDLVSMNDTYNLHLIDTEFSMSWVKSPTLFTNCDVDTASADVEYETVAGTIDNPLPSQQAIDDGIILGPDRKVKLNTTGIDDPFIEYKAPQVDLGPLDEVMGSWIRNFAFDWNVRINTAGAGSANSGFQLVVEEIDNLELRKKRAKMTTAGFKRLFEVQKVVTNQHAEGTYADDSVLIVEFSEPRLPVEKDKNEQTWSEKISAGRASIIDYLMEEKGLSLGDAIDRAEEINKFNELFKNGDGITPPDITK